MLEGAFVLGATVLSSVLLKTLAQNQTAKCTSEGYTGYYNSRGEDPCTIATQVGQSCDKDFWIPAASSQAGVIAMYSLGDYSDMPCLCSTIFYALFDLCARCQGAQVPAWETLSSNCSHTFETEWPPGVPFPSDPIPHYAFLPLSSDGHINFDATRIDNQPEVTADPQSTSPTSTSATTSATTSPTPTQTADSTTHTGAIAGGVVGGVLGMVILTALLFFVRRRLIQKKAIDRAGNGNIQPFSRWVTGPEQGSALRNSNGAETQKLYNPEDPSTFPGIFLSLALLISRVDRIPSVRLAHCQKSDEDVYVPYSTLTTRIYVCSIAHSSELWRAMSVSFSSSKKAFFFGVAPIDPQLSKRHPFSDPSKSGERALIPADGFVPPLRDFKKLYGGPPLGQLLLIMWYYLFLYSS
ncbi:hypothetical protein K435DRAFT_811444 [Dendrothele bispora CBS 962.96]|uniref:Uncharacterized protein n=1 Tax=Dendrothele bispora (strain CBS 962.96) TaxID=1314807 RepID=A0A4S8KRY9_DENBC|nr:hypothetical protein K435DRAFT_811444 [Dendrothele bispora CBS 962.96]